MDNKAISHLPVTAVLAALVSFGTSIGKLKLMEVEATTDNFFEGQGIVMNNEELLKALVDIDDLGDFAIRVGFHTAASSVKLTTTELTEEQVMRTMIGKAADGKPYLRIALQELA
jgi:hypothetical protein